MDSSHKDVVIALNVLAQFVEEQTGSAVAPIDRGDEADVVLRYDNPLFHRDVPWIVQAMSVAGLHERTDKKELMEFLSSDGLTVGDPSEVSWCGDFVQTCLSRALTPQVTLPTNPFVARAWLDFGYKLEEPAFGSIAVFWRNHPASWQGHVGFVVGRRDAELTILGGNQGNSVSLANISEKRLIGCVWPVSTPPNEKYAV